MPLTPIGNVGSMLDRAFVAYLVASGCDNSVPSHAVAEKAFPVLIVNAAESQENPKFSGIEIYDLKLIARASAAKQPSQTNNEANRKVIDNLIGIAMAAIMQTSDGQSLKAACDAITAAGRALAVSDPDNHADMADFTLLFMEYSGANRNEIPSGGFEEIRHFICHACATAIS